MFFVKQEPHRKSCFLVYSGWKVTISHMRSTLFLLLIFALAACAAPLEETAVIPTIVPTETATRPPDTPTPLPTSEPIATEVPPEESDEVEENGRLPNLNGRFITIAVENNYLPFNYILAETGEPNGWDYEVWDEVCALLNCVPVFETAVWTDLLTAVASGQYDAAAGSIAITPERAELVEFSDSYLSVEQRLMARSDEHLFTTVDEFVAGDSFIVGVRANDTTADTANALLDAERIQPFAQYPALFDALGAGDIDAMIIQTVIGEKLQQDYKGVEAQRFKFASGVLSHERLGFIFPLGSDLTQPVNAALYALYLDGTMSRLSRPYFSEEFAVMYSDIER